MKLILLTAAMTAIAFQAAAQPEKKNWFMGGANVTICSDEESPADRARFIEKYEGRKPEIREYSSGKVEVGYEKPNGNYVFWNFYRTMDACVADLPRNKIRKYE